MTNWRTDGELCANPIYTRIPNPDPEYPNGIVGQWPGVEKLDAELDEGARYEWDVLWVFRNRYDGTLRYYADCGCSCNGPEPEGSWESLEPINDETWKEFTELIDRKTRGYHSKPEDPMAARAVEFLAEVAGYLKEGENWPKTTTDGSGSPADSVQ
jgi:hypothetical protein